MKDNRQSNVQRLPNARHGSRSPTAGKSQLDIYIFGGAGVNDPALYLKPILNGIIVSY